MGAGMQIFGPSGESWFDTGDMTGRVSGYVFITSPNPSLPNLGSPNYSYFVDYPVVRTTAPWVYVMGQNSTTAVIQTLNKTSDTSVRMTFNLSYPSTGWPSGTTITIYYGFG